MLKAGINNYPTMSSGKPNAKFQNQKKNEKKHANMRSAGFWCSVLILW